MLDFGLELEVFRAYVGIEALWVCSGSQLE